jgi:hypothetical protein
MSHSQRLSGECADRGSYPSERFPSFLPRLVIQFSIARRMRSLSSSRVVEYLERAQTSNPKASLLDVRHRTNKHVTPFRRCLSPRQELPDGRGLARQFQTIEAGQNGRKVSCNDQFIRSDLVDDETQGAALLAPTWLLPAPCAATPWAAPTAFPPRQKIRAVPGAGTRWDVVGLGKTRIASAIARVMGEADVAFSMHRSINVQPEEKGIRLLNNLTANDTRSI